MAKLVSRPQAIRAGVLYPAAVYSRVTSCIGYIKGAVFLARAFTPPVAEHVWLLGVDVWFAPKPVGDADSVSFRVLSGYGKPATPAEILNWENVLPVYFPDGGIVSWRQYGSGDHMHWDMSRLFTGAGRRFGFWLSVSPAIDILEMYASFQISEG